MDGFLNASPEDAPLPPLRQDLRLIAVGPGAWKIHDPLAQRYFELDQEAVDLMACWQEGATPRSLRARAELCNGRAVSTEALLALWRFFEHNELLTAQPQQSFRRARARSGAGQGSLWHRLLHGYLFFRVPLARPDAFLRRTLPFVAWAFSPVFWSLIALLGLGGLWLLSRQWEAFLATVPRMFDATGLITYGLSLTLVKALHEMGHGYTAVRLGSRVSTMGVAMIVMVPVAYTDTTDAWRLASRADRVRIDIAGMAVEILVAVLATLAWVFLPDGAMRTVTFALATTGWIMSLAVNLNPLMRFDGYYLMSDLVGVPNLQERSFAFARWWTRELLFGYGDAQPEPASVARRRALVAFAWATWVYRFFLFLGIALLVYHFFFKILGIFLFAVEIWWFIARPIWRELAVWIARRGQAGRRVRLSLAVGALLLVGLVLPWPSTLRIPAVLAASQQAPAYAPRPGRVEQVLVQPGARVKVGEVLVRLSAPALDDGLARSAEAARGLEQRLGRRAADERDRADSLVLAGQLDLERDRGAGLARERERLLVRAPVDGVVVEVSPELHAGRWVDDKTRLMLVAQPAALQARGYIEGTELARIAEGATGRFVDEARLAPPREVRVGRIAAAASESLDSALLGSAAGGPVPVRHEGRGFKPEQAVFEIVAAVQAGGDKPGPAPALTEVRGELQVRGQAQSLAGRALRRVVQVLVRETVL